LKRCESRPDMVLQFDHSLTERREVALDDGRKDSQEHQPAESFSDTIGHGGEITKGSELVWTMPAPGTGRLNNQDRPIFWEWQSCNERRRVGLIAPAPVNN
jgi:hypothetical protein